MKISLWLIVLIFLIVMIQFRTTQRPVSPNYGEDKGKIWASIHMDWMLKYPYWYSKTESLVTVSAQFFFSNSVKICFLSIASFNLFLSFPIVCLINVLSLYSDFCFSAPSFHFHIDFNSVFNVYIFLEDQYLVILISTSFSCLKHNHSLYLHLFVLGCRFYWV